MSDTDPGSNTDPGRFWPEGARLVISISMQFEAGAQPERGAQGPFPPLDPQYPDLPMQKWYECGFKEGIPRLLDLWDAKGVKVTSHMVGQAVERHPELARDIVGRGHEAAGHGQIWTPQFSMTPEDERTSYVQSIAFWLRGTPPHDVDQHARPYFRHARPGARAGGFHRLRKSTRGRAFHAQG
jgi:peptidoglycan/xylan/chitin deacetylase (PgdA/CDA1 family)